MSACAAESEWADAIAKAEAEHPGVNIELLLKTLAHIEANQELWRQDNWVTKTECGTAYCFAGWALAMAGHEVREDPGSGIRTLVDGKPVRNTVTMGHGVAPLAEMAAAELGIPAREFGIGHGLFQSYNDLDDLRHHIEELTGLDLDDRIVSVE